MGAGCGRQAQLRELPHQLQSRRGTRRRIAAGGSRPLCQPALRTRAARLSLSHARGAYGYAPQAREVVAACECEEGGAACQEAREQLLQARVALIVTIIVPGKAEVVNPHKGRAPVPLLEAAAPGEQSLVLVLRVVGVRVAATAAGGAAIEREWRADSARPQVPARAGCAQQPASRCSAAR